MRQDFNTDESWENIATNYEEGRELVEISILDMFELEGIACLTEITE